MKTKRHKHPAPLRKHVTRSHVAGATAVLLCGIAGTWLLQQSYADTTGKPYGSINHCTLENNQTVIHGWAADPNATPLTLPYVKIKINATEHTIPTSVAGYRDSRINAFIDQHHPGDPKPGTYGFRLTVAGLYTGTRNTISGQTVNVGIGTDTNLSINTAPYADNPTANTFPRHVIPEACLATKPAPAPTQPAQAPAPSSAPSQPTQPSRAPTQAGPATGTRPANPSLAPAVTTLSDETGAKVKAGTLAAEFSIPADGAHSVRIKYGPAADNLLNETADQPVTGDTATVRLQYLNPLTEYFYQIIRTKGDQPEASSTGSVTTAGYAVSLRVSNKQGRPIEGIKAVLTPLDTDATSDKHGLIRFKDVPEGNYVIALKQDGQSYRQPVEASARFTPEAVENPEVVTLDYVLNLPTEATSSSRQHGSNLWLLVMTVLLVPVLVGAGIWRYVIQNRKPKVDTPPVGTTAPHTGESLKQMVLQSMAEEARRRGRENDR